MYKLSCGLSWITQFIFTSLKYSNWTNDMFVQDYYKILEVDYDAPEETIRSNYIRLALVRCFIIKFYLWFLRNDI